MKSKRLYVPECLPYRHVLVPIYAIFIRNTSAVAAYHGLVTGTYTPAQAARFRADATASNYTTFNTVSGADKKASAFVIYPPSSAGFCKSVSTANSICII